MSNLGPGDKPAVVRRRARKNRRPRNQPSTEARKGAAFGSRPARPLPKPRAAPAPRPARSVARPVQAKPLQATPPRNIRAGKPVRTKVQKRGVERAARTQAREAAKDAARARERAVRAVAATGGELSSFATTAAERAAANVAAERKRSRRQASAVAPALKALDQVSRPAHALAAAEVSDIKRGGVKELFAIRSPTSKAAKERRTALKRGFQLKDRSLGSDVLKAAGVKNKAVAAAGGFVLDVVQDPTTRLTGGTGSVAEKAAVKTAARVARKAHAVGASAETAERLGEAAGRRAAKEAPKGRGVVIRYGPHEVPLVRRGTAAAGQAAGKAARKVAPRAARAVPKKARAVARNFAPRVRPADVTEEQFFAGRAAARQARARVTTQTQRAMTHASKLQQELSKDDYAKVIDAIERNDLSRLPTKELAHHAHVLRSQLKGARRASRRAGVAAGHRVGDTSRFLSKADIKRLDNSIAAEQRAQKRAISRAVSKEQHARERALVTEAVGSKSGRRAGKAATRYMDRAADTHLNTQKLKAAQQIPKQGRGESHEAYLHRVAKYARSHDLPLVRKRAEKLLAKKPSDVAKGYFPREYDERILKKLGVTQDEADAGAGAVRRVGGAGPGLTVGKTTAGFQRGENRRLAVVNEEARAAGKPGHSENIPLVVVNHMREAARATSQGEFAKALAKAGRRVKQGDELKPGEAVYKLGYRGKTFGLHEHSGAIPKTGRSGGQYIALNRHLKEAMEGSAAPAQARNEVAHIYDAATGGFKRLATATIGFHVRNMIGDVTQAYTGEIAGHRLPRTIAQATRATARASEQARHVIPPRTEAKIKVAGKAQHIDEFLKGAKRNGVLDSGYIGRELHDLGAKASGQVRVKGERGPLKGVRQVGRNRAVQLDRWMTNRENVMRLATYKHALDRGLSEERAAEIANMIHVDYSELSDLERKVMRRVFPFYTWTARSLPVQAKLLVQKPGKFATLEKAREETAAAFGMDEEATRRGMTEATQRQVPFVIRLPGKDPIAVSASIPTTLLNELPAGASPAELNRFLNEWGRFTTQMVTPFLRAPLEGYINRQFYTKQDIESDRRVLTAAPSWVKWLPDEAKKTFMVTPDYIDKRTGKKTWGWRGYADWGFRQIPGAPQQVSQLASGGRPGQPKDTAAAVAGAVGIRADSLNAQAKLNAEKVRIAKRLAKLNRRATILNQQGIHTDNATPEYKRLRKEINALTKQVRPPKKRGRRRSAGPLPLGGGGSGGKLPLGGGSTGGKLPLGGG